MILENYQHEAFAQGIVKGLTQRAAAIEAGYSEHTATEAGSRLIRKPQVSARIKELQTQSANRVITQTAVTKEWVIQQLVGITQECTRKAHYNPSAANKSLELIGKEMGMFRDSIPIEVFNLALAQMGAIVAKFVADQDALDAIAKGWDEISLAKQIKAIPDSTPQ